MVALKEKRDNLPSTIRDLLPDFEQYMITRQDKDSATVVAYLYDISCYADFYTAEIDLSQESFAITPELLVKYVTYLRNRNLRNSTVERRLMGLSSFWRYLYKEHRDIFPTPPVRLDDLDIAIKRRTNQTHGLAPAEYLLLRRRLKDELARIY